MTKLALSPSRWPSRLLVLFCLVPFTFAGCGSSKPMGTVKGTVTLNGSPYADAAVIFLSLKTGQAASADIQAGGAFQLTEPLPTGTYTVYLAPKAAGASDQPAPVSIDRAVPDKYWNEAASDIKIDVKEGANDVKVELIK